jgi:hypothetical protein
MMAEVKVDDHPILQGGVEIRSDGAGGILLEISLSRRRRTNGVGIHWTPLQARSAAEAILKFAGSEGSGMQRGR